MNGNGVWQRVLYWTPRGLGIVFALFLSLFALDIFGQGYSAGEVVVGLLLHLIPVYLVIIALILAWRWPWVGAILFPALGIAYVVLTKGREHWTAYAVIAAPLILIGVLFLFNWVYRGQLRHG